MTTRTHPIRSVLQNVPAIKLFALIVILAFAAFIKPPAGQAAPAAGDIGPHLQAELTGKFKKNRPFSVALIKPAVFLTIPTTATVTQTLPPETGPAPSVCPSVPEAGTATLARQLASNLFGTATNLAGAFLPDSTLEERVNILLLGSDGRPGEKLGRADTMMLVTIDPGAKTAGMLSIPRDLWVAIPGYGEHRINQAYRLGEIKGHPGGGPALARETVEANLGLPVHHYILVDFSGFEQIVDTLGGIELCVPETIDAAAYYGYTPDSIDKSAYSSFVPVDPAGPGAAVQTGQTAEAIEAVERDQAGAAPTVDDAAETAPARGYKFLYIEAGRHTLDGPTALRYARTRASVTADFARVKRQQAVLLAMRQKALQIDLIAKLPELWESMSHLVVTDMQLADALQLAPLAYQIALTDIQTGAIGHDQTIDYRTASGARVLLPRRAEIKRLIEATFGPSDPSAPLTQAEMEFARTEAGHPATILTVEMENNVIAQSQ